MEPCLLHKSVEPYRPKKEPPKQQVVTPGKKVPDEIIQQMVQYAKQGHTVQEVAEHFGIWASTARRYVKEHAKPSKKQLTTEIIHGS